jgi:hypothetical protein
MKNLSLISWIAFAVAVCAWAGVGFFAWSIQGEESDRATALANAQQSSTAEFSSARMHAMAQDSAPERTALEGLLAGDVVTIVNMLEALGTTSGAKLKLSGALPETAPAGLPAGSSIQAVGFAIEADGKFAALMRVVQLLETLPVPSSVVRLDMQHTPGAGDAWHLSVYITVLMNSTSSS